MTNKDQRESAGQAGGVAKTTTTNYPNPYIPPEDWELACACAKAMGMRSPSAFIRMGIRTLGKIVMMVNKEGEV